MPEDYSLASLMAGGRRRTPYDGKRRFAEQMMQMGADSSPVLHPLQGAARLAQALVGGWMANKADSEEKDAETKRNETLSAELAKMDPNGSLSGIAKLDPSLALKIAGQGLVEKQKIAAQGQQRGQQATDWVGGYGAPQGGQIQQGPLPPPGQGGYQGTLSGLESDNNPTATNPQSGAAGQFQFMPATWAEVRAKNPDLNLPPDPRQAPPELQAEAEKRFRASNAQALQGAGIEPTPANLYLAHRTGAQGAQTLLRADPRAPMSSVVPANWIAQNPDMQGKTVGQFLQLAQQRFGGGPQGQPGQAPPAPPVTVQATPPQGNATQPGPPLTVNMRGPGGVPQGSADGAMPPMQGAPPPPQAPGGVPAVTAQPPSIPDVPRPQPNPQTIQRLQGMIRNGLMTPQQAEAAMNAEIDRDWGVARDRAKMQFQQQTTDFADQRRAQREMEKDERNRGQPTRQEIEKLHTARTEAATIVSALEDFRREFENTGTWSALKSVAGATTPVNTAYNTAALLAKGEQLFNLGVLNGPDLDIIRRTLPDPSTAKGAMTSTQDMGSAVNKVIDLLQTRLASREKQLGLPITDVRGVANELRATQPGGATQQPSNGPIAPGAIEEGYRFKGGNPADKNNWERVR